MGACAFLKKWAIVTVCSDLGSGFRLARGLRALLAMLVVPSPTFHDIGVVILAIIGSFLVVLESNLITSTDEASNDFIATEGFLRF